MMGSLSSAMKASLNRAGRALGLEIRLNGPAARDDLRLARFLADQGIELVLDVGANRGQFASALFDGGYGGRILSFEALPAAHAELCENAKAHRARWLVAPRVALSDRAGTATFHVNRSDATSSLLPASQRSLETIDALSPAGSVEVPQQRLDDYSDEYGFAAQRTFLKLDVQGGEGLVLAGATQTLQQVVGLVVELSFQPLYEGQQLALDVLPALQRQGFEVHDIAPAYRDPVSFQLLQADFVLFHPARIDAARRA